MDSPPSITYSSTRGGQKNLRFRDVVMTGLAHDRGLFVPDSFPSVSKDELESWRSLSYSQLAVKVISLYVKEDEVPRRKLEDIVTRSCASFRCKDVTPVIPVGGHYVLELFHGPTFAFKDVALQMLGNFFEFFLSTGSNDGRLAVLGATSGDTGSAAIYGLRGKKGVDCVILYPRGRVSEIQERQMATVADSNIHCLAVDGTFDDCQDLVKASFADSKFRDRVKLGAVNSINWCRVLAQTTYYFWSYLRVTDNRKDISAVNFSVPTGNFGDILAGYYAKRMGLPVGKLIVATNENDILHRFFTKGEYHRYDIAQSISPSMDICVSSNFERYLYHLADEDAVILESWMKAFESTGKLTITGKKLDEARRDFLSARADTSQTLKTIHQYHDKYGYMLCPHSAVGVIAIHQLGEVNLSTVCLATAHWAKFPDACKKAVDPLPTTPRELLRLYNLPMRSTNTHNDLQTVENIMEERIEQRIVEESKKRVSRDATLQHATKAIVTATAICTIALVVQMVLSKKR